MLKLFSLITCFGAAAPAAEPDLILHRGKIVTADQGFSIHKTISIANGKIQLLGSNVDSSLEPGKLVFKK